MASVNDLLNRPEPNLPPDGLQEALSTIEAQLNSWSDAGHTQRARDRPSRDTRSQDERRGTEAAQYTVPRTRVDEGGATEVTTATRALPRTQGLSYERRPSDNTAQPLGRRNSQTSLTLQRLHDLMSDGDASVSSHHPMTERPPSPVYMTYRSLGRPPSPGTPSVHTDDFSRIANPTLPRPPAVHAPPRLRRLPSSSAAPHTRHTRMPEPGPGANEESEPQIEPDDTHLEQALREIRMRRLLATDRAFMPDSRSPIPELISELPPINIYRSPRLAPGREETSIMEPRAIEHVRPTQQEPVTQDIDTNFASQPQPAPMDPPPSRRTRNRQRRREQTSDDEPMIERTRTGSSWYHRPRPQQAEAPQPENAVQVPSTILDPALNLIQVILTFISAMCFYSLVK
ncbi:hypothetical protein DXG01_010471 [Tephrocybe rancida]|nr:hypothetical protein DXG01_010471 [Tephrocybe rancida]